MTTEHKTVLQRIREYGLPNTAALIATQWSEGKPAREILTLDVSLDIRREYDRINTTMRGRHVLTM